MVKPSPSQGENCGFESRARYAKFFKKDLIMQDEVNDTEDDTTWTLTPKGFLFIKLMPFGISAEEFDKIWKDFREFCEQKVQ